ncbi:abortive infection protein [Calothrix sp. NIES-4071]|nr:abortive infection protein [Calothrix sp. NIES-4071]BAZ61167.1 abortive infection protein [Calothrix sp. NIES-4105]
MTQQQNQEPEIPFLTRTQVLIAMGVTAIILWIIAKICLQFANVPLMAWRWDEAAFLSGIVLGLAITALSGVAYRFSAAYRRSADYYLEIVLKPLVLPDLIWLGLLPGLSEELLFRGVLLPALGASHLAVFVSSVSFGVLHLSGPSQWPYVAWATIVGFVFGYSALISGNLLVPIVAHIVTNLISSYVWKMKQA